LTYRAIADAVRATDAIVVGDGGTPEVLPPAVAGADWTGAWNNDAVGVYVVGHGGVIIHRP
jgi:hypothetical protein